MLEAVVVADLVRTIAKVEETIDPKSRALDVAQTAIVDARIGDRAKIGKHHPDPVVVCQVEPDRRRRILRIRVQRVIISCGSIALRVIGCRVRHAQHCGDIGGADGQRRLAVGGLSVEIPDPICLVEDIRHVCRVDHGKRRVWVRGSAGFVGKIHANDKHPLCPGAPPHWRPVAYAGGARLPVRCRQSRR